MPYTTTGTFYGSGNIAGNTGTSIQNDSSFLEYSFSDEAIQQAESINYTWGQPAEYVEQLRNLYAQQSSSHHWSSVPNRRTSVDEVMSMNNDEENIPMGEFDDLESFE